MTEATIDGIVTAADYLCSVGIGEHTALKLIQKHFPAELIEPDVALETLKAMNEQYQSLAYAFTPDGEKIADFGNFIDYACSGEVKGLSGTEVQQLVSCGVSGIGGLARNAQVITTEYDNL